MPLVLPLPIYASTAWVSASIPVVEVIFFGSPVVKVGSSNAYSGISAWSLIAYFSCVCELVMTAAKVVSLPVPAVVGIATSIGSFLPTLSMPFI